MIVLNRNCVDTVGCLFHTIKRISAQSQVIVVRNMERDKFLLYNECSEFTYIEFRNINEIIRSESVRILYNLFYYGCIIEV